MDLEQVRALYAHRPTEFVAARDALAKDLKAAGARDDAAAAKRLRRHRPVDWVLNRVADTDAGVTRSFADAATEVRNAQSAAIEARSGGNIRDAMASLRERSSDVVAAAARVDAGVPSADVTAALLELAADEQHTQQFVNGILGSTAPVGVDLFAGLEPGPAPARDRPAATSPTKRGRTARRGTRPEASAAEDARERARARSVEQAEVAQRRLDEARGASDTAVAAEAAATRRVDELRQALADAEDDLRGASSARRRAASTTAAAERTARRAVEKLAALDGNG